MPGDTTSPHPRPNYRRLFLLLPAGLAGCLLALAYSPPLADSLESLLFARLALSYTDDAPALPADVVLDEPVVRLARALPADKAALDDDTPVIGVLAAGRARAYLVEAFDHGPPSHIVNDVLGEVPVSVTRCDITGCVRVFTGPVPGRPLELAVGGLKDQRMVLKFDGRLYRQENSEPLDEASPPLPCGDYPAELVPWGTWRRAHPGTDVYMGAVDEAAPPEGGRVPKDPSSAAPLSDTSP